VCSSWKDVIDSHENKLWKSLYYSQGFARKKTYDTASDDVSWKYKCLVKMGHAEYFDTKQRRLVDGIWLEHLWSLHSNVFAVALFFALFVCLTQIIRNSFFYYFFFSIVLLSLALMSLRLMLSLRLEMRKKFSPLKLKWVSLVFSLRRLTLS
jgi:hypothetical protein